VVQVRPMMRVVAILCNHSLFLKTEGMEFFHAFF